MKTYQTIDLSVVLSPAELAAQIELAQERHLSTTGHEHEVWARTLGLLLYMKSLIEAGRVAA